MIRRYFLYILGLVTVSLLMLLPILGLSKRNIVNNTQHEKSIFPFDKIEQAARNCNRMYREKVSDKEKRKAVTELYDTMFDLTKHYNIPEHKEKDIKSRLIEAEIQYREGNHHPISEVDLVRAINNVNKQYSLPEYANTFVAQTRVLRVQTKAQIPNLIGQGHSYTKASDYHQVRGGITTEMSPAEAAFVSLHIIMQKEVNPYYQTTPTEWAEQQHKIRNQMIEQKNITGSKKKEPELVILNNPRKHEMKQAMSNLNLNLLSDNGNILDSFLDDLGVNKLSSKEK